MSPLFWASFALVLYTYAGYPLIALALARFFPTPWHRAPQQRTVTILMAVRNGATMLRAKLDQLLALDPNIVTQIIVVSDGSTDDTNTILNERIDPRLFKHILQQQAGKSTALNHGLVAATGNILVFTDIRPTLEPASLRALLENFADGRVGCAAGELSIRAGHTQDAATENIGGLYWRYEQSIRIFESTFASPVGVYGGFYAVRRRLARPFPDGLILDDMFQPLSVLRQGYRSVLDTDATVTDSWPAQTSAEFGRKVRTLAGNFQLLARAPWILTPANPALFQLVSHKLLRLLVPYAFVVMLLTACILATHSVAWALIALAQILFWTIGLISLRRRIPLASAIGALLVLNAAAVVGLYRFLCTRGPLWKIWSTPATPRDSA